MVYFINSLDLLKLPTIEYCQLGLKPCVVINKVDKENRFAIILAFVKTAILLIKLRGKIIDKASNK